MATNSGGRSNPACRAAALLIGIACGSIAGCGDSSETSDDQSEPTIGASATPWSFTAGVDGEGFNVVLVSVDTTRADHLGCYGHPDQATPNLDRLAAEGTRFAQCISSAPSTLPSHAAILTGSYPFVHGARSNMGFKLGDENRTLAELFQDAGYVTHAEVAAAVLNHSCGIDQGFDTFTDPVRVRLGVSLGQGSDRDRSELESVTLRSQRRADDITENALEFLRRNREQRFFLFLHYFDPHQPYAAPEPFSQRFEDPYVAEIAYVDAQFGEVVNGIRELGLDERTLIVLTSDHGEGRGEHDESSHTFFVYDTTQHVPLILWSPARIPAGRVVQSQVRLIDLASTIADFARLDPTPQMQGRTLLPLAEQPHGDLKLACYGETLDPRLTFGYAALRFLRADGWKYIHAPTPKLFHVEEDPRELNDLAGQHADRVQSMRDQLRDLIARSPNPPGGRAASRDIDNAQLRELEALGYIGGASAGARVALAAGDELDDFEPAGDDPHDKAKELRVYSHAVGLRLSGDYQNAAKFLRGMLALDPDNPAVVKEYAKCLAGSNRIDEAIPAYRQACELNPADAWPRIELARLLVRRGNLQVAEAEYRHALALDPKNSAAPIGLARLLMRDGRSDQAFATYQAASEKIPESVDLIIGWGESLRAAGRLQAAEQKFREACRLRPHRSQAFVQRAGVLMELNRADEAIASLTAFLEAHPDDARATRTLGALHLKIGDTEAALGVMQRAIELDPDSAQTQFEFGFALQRAGQHSQAVKRFRAALEIDATFAAAQMALARSLAQLNRDADAIAAYQRVIEMQPKYGRAYVACANLLTADGAYERAIELLRNGRRTLPKHPKIAETLAWLLATAPDGSLRNGAEALRLAETLNASADGRDARVLEVLAAAYAETDRFAEALTTIQQAIARTEQDQDANRNAELQARLELYKRGQAYRLRRD